MCLRVVIVEDDPDYGAKLEDLLKKEQGITVEARFQSPSSFLVAAKELAEKGEVPWDLILMDLCSPRMNGIQATRSLKEFLPALPVIIFTVFETPASIVRAIRPSSDGQHLMHTSTHELLTHLRALTVSTPSTPRPGVRQRFQIQGLRPATLALYANLRRKRSPN